MSDDGPLFTSLKTGILHIAGKITNLRLVAIDCSHSRGNNYYQKGTSERLSWVFYDCKVILLISSTKKLFKSNPNVIWIIIKNTDYSKLVPGFKS